ncbi:hypothetical protein FB567DRAFT_247386 [Paraphoma chrysanthemicola]|uniref:Uncharacterized protein n=1 Tax=Paraphoma chrysanthemicola TaxID=798071 RepID=A0A8K0VSE8_9PLEO|nr:hypothetical protein FB567DRAFT_247386 [Paraphoma chrysanthemicola]
MLLTRIFCVLLAPTSISAAAFPWAIPEPTVFAAAAADNWSPAPTPAPQFRGFELFKRQATEGDNTCAFISGASESSITCPTNSICATNTLYGVQGCCNPYSLSACTIPTTCIPSAAVSTLCTDSTCSSNNQVLKCTAQASPECYRYVIQYAKTVMTQHGCAANAFTASALRSWGVQSSVPNEPYRTVTVAVTPSTSPTPTLTPPQPSSKKPNLGAIIGGTIGGCTFLTLLGLMLFILHRRRNASSTLQHQKPPPAQFHAPLQGVTEFNPHGYPTATTYQDKNWQQVTGPVHRPSDAMPEYPGMGAGRYGVVEVEGIQRPVEVDGEGEGGGFKYVGVGR